MKNRRSAHQLWHIREILCVVSVFVLTRYVIVDALNPAFTSSVQWFERTLDDSANKRISITGLFGGGCYFRYIFECNSGLVVYDKVIKQRIMSELPFMATENILMEAVKKAGTGRSFMRESAYIPWRLQGLLKRKAGKRPLDRIADDKAF